MATLGGHGNGARVVAWGLPRPPACLWAPAVAAVWGALSPRTALHWRALRLPESGLGRMAQGQEAWSEKAQTPGSSLEKELFSHSCLLRRAGCLYELFI